MRRGHNHIDLGILISVLTLMVLSLGVVYSASSSVALKKFGESGYYLGVHTLKTLAGFVAILVCMNIDYHRYRRFTKPVLLGAIVFLAVTLVMGGEVKGASRWLRLGGVGFQPSELAKYALIFHLSVLIAEKKERLNDFKTGFLPMILWIGTVTLLVLLQPNFSTGAMIFGISLVMLFIARARPAHLLMTVGALAPLLLVYMVSAPYRMRRILNFLGGEGGGGNYQVFQGIIGFGNGGLLGVGPGESRQRDFFLPESYGDFVFSIVGEEYGLIGTLVMMGLFFVIMARGLRVARYAPDNFGRLLAAGITATVTLYALVNAGVTLGILPTTGLPMPFVSYGGSAMFFSSMAVGVLLNISAQTDMYPRIMGAPDAVRPVNPLPSAAAGKLY